MIPSPPAAETPRRMYIDLTHLGRHVTGIERVSIEQFEQATFVGADVRHVRSRGLVTMILAQQLLLPLLALANPRALFVFPGFPPSPLFPLLFASRTVLYVHDCFLLTRRADLGLKAKLYMAWPFARAVSALRYFLTNSEKTARELSAFARPDAEIGLYRPTVRNAFGLGPGDRRTRPRHTSPLRLVSLGTVEPRKNYAAAVAIRDALAARGIEARLDIVGRPGWGEAAAALAGRANVVVHGYLPAHEARAVIEAADLYLCTSHDEGLGLPLVEAQYAGLPVVAPDAPVFREVLGASGLLIDPARPDDAARAIAAMMAADGWRATATDTALANVARWNCLAAADACEASALARRMADAQPQTTPRTA